MTARSEWLFLQLALAFQIVGKRLPLGCAFLDVGLRLLVIDELRRIAVVQILVALIGVGDHVIMQDEVGECSAVPVADETADHEQDIVA